MVALARKRFNFRNIATFQISTVMLSAPVVFILADINSR